MAQVRHYTWRQSTRPDLVDKAGTELPRQGMKATRVKLPAVLRAELLDEVRSHCPHCGTQGVRNLEAHHIDGDRSRTVSENLIMLCKTCHGKADQQLINRAFVADIKKWLKKGYHFYLDAPGRKNEAPKISVETNHGNVAENISFNYHGIKPPKSAPNPGTIEASPAHREYVRYLAKRYMEWRKKGVDSMGDKRTFSATAVWPIIERKLGFSAYKAPLPSFTKVVSTICTMIDNTAFGRLNGAKAVRNYHSFDEHKSKMGL